MGAPPSVIRETGPSSVLGHKEWSLLLLLAIVIVIVIVISFSHLLGNFEWGLKIDMHKTHPIKC